MEVVQEVPTVLREVVILREARLALVLEVHCVPCHDDPDDEEAKEDGDRRSASAWMTPSLWKELLALVAPVAEDHAAATLAAAAGGGGGGRRKGASSSSRRQAVTLQGDRLRLACTVRRNNLDGLRVVSPSPSRWGNRIPMHGNKLVVAAATLSSGGSGATLRRLHRAVGADYDGEKISHYFDKTSSAQQ